MCNQGSGHSLELPWTWIPLLKLRERNITQCPHRTLVAVGTEKDRLLLHHHPLWLSIVGALWGEASDPDRGPESTTLLAQWLLAWDTSSSESDLPQKGASCSLPWGIAQDLVPFWLQQVKQDRAARKWVPYRVTNCPRSPGTDDMSWTWQLVSVLKPGKSPAKQHKLITPTSYFSLDIPGAWQPRSMPRGDPEIQIENNWPKRLGQLWLLFKKLIESTWQDCWEGWECVCGRGVGGGWSVLETIGTQRPSGTERNSWTQIDRWLMWTRKWRWGALLPPSSQRLLSSRALAAVREFRH